MLCHYLSLSVYIFTSQLSNFPVVDKNGVFMHGIAALQEMVRREARLRAEIADIGIDLGKRQHIFDEIVAKLSASAAEKHVQRLALAESALRNEQTRLDIESARTTDEQMFMRLALEEERAVLEKQEALLQERQKALEETEQERFHRTTLLEKQLNEASLERMERHATALQLAQKQADDQFDQQKLALEKERIKAETESRIAQEKAGEEVAIRKLKAKAHLEAEKWHAVVRTISNQIQQVLHTVISNPQQLMLIVGCVLLLVWVYNLAREMILVLREFIQTQLGKPSLVRETSYSWSFWPLRVLSWSGGNGNWRMSAETDAQEIAGHFRNVVLGPAVQERISQLALATRNTRKSGAPFRHLLLHGPPGTGKTLIARTLAASSGLDYAVMSGGDVGPLGEDAVNQLHRLFRWAEQSSKGLLLFIDEAEAFLNARAVLGGDDTVHRRHALNALLYQTGSQSRNFMLVLATNRPEDLDSAVLDRMDATVLVDIPERTERLRLVKLYLESMCATPARASQMQPWWQPLRSMVSGLSKGGADFANSGVCYVDADCENEAFLVDLTRQIDGFSGREISKLFIAARHAMLMDPQRRLTVGGLKAVTEVKVMEHRQKRGFDKNGVDDKHRARQPAANADGSAAEVSTDSSATKNSGSRSVRK